MKSVKKNVLPISIFKCLLQYFYFKIFNNVISVQQILMNIYVFRQVKLTKKIPNLKKYY
jgi:hypothetical protein